MQAFEVIAKQRIRKAAARGDLDGVPGWPPADRGGIYGKLLCNA
jgi:hypothetical protein